MADGFDQEARYASLDERVRNQGTQISALEQEMRRSFSTLANGLDNINAKLTDTHKPQWQALGVMLSAVIVVGTLAYWPIREAQSRFENALVGLSKDTTDKFENTIPLQQFRDFKETYENNRALNRIDNNARFEKLERTATDSVSRSEIEARLNDIQRQIDQKPRSLP
jgi:hypothetical protein